MPTAPGVARVVAALEARGFEPEVREFPAGTRTAEDAAAAIGCDVAQIAKSLVFRAGDRPVLVVTSGAHRVDEKLVAKVVGHPITKADAGFVRSWTGFAIGGVPPVGHDRPVDTYLDEDLVALDEVWAAAGSPTTVFRVRGADLADLTGGIVCLVT